MVKTSLLAATLATASALALPTDFQRREQDLVARQLPRSAAGLLQSRGFVDEEDLFLRDYEPFEDLEARSIASNAIGDGVGLAKNEIKTGFAKKIVNWAGMGNSQQYQRRDLEDSDDLLGRDLDVEDLEARSTVSTALSDGAGLAKKEIKTGIASKILSWAGMDNGQQYRRRDLEDSDGLFGRDLDIEELFGREYDFDGEDFFERDLEAAELD